MQQRLVAELGAHPGEAGGELRVEEVRDVRRPHAAQQRDVLAAGMHDDLDRGIGEDLRQRLRVERAVQRVEDLDAQAVGSLDGDLHEAQERLVAPLAHELRVDAQAAACARHVGKLRDVARDCQVGHPARDPIPSGLCVRAA